MIIENLSLNNIYGLENVDPGSIWEIGIHNNPVLSNCDAQGICNYLIFPNATINITSNTPGCNSQEEIEEACFSNVGEIEKPEAFRASPNPCSETLFLEVSNIDHQNMNFDMFDLTGTKVKSILVENNESEINLSELPTGIYFCVLNGKDRFQPQKIIKL